MHIDKTVTKASTMLIIKKQTSNFDYKVWVLCFIHCSLIFSILENCGIE